MAYRKKTTGKSWVKNFGRSVMFGVGDAMKTQMPAVTSVLSDDNIEYIRSMKETINDIRRGQIDLAKYFEDQENGKEVVDAGKDLINASADAIKNFIKTGNASVDKETQERMEAKMMGFDEDDFDFGDDDDFEKSIMRDIKADDIDLSPIEEKTAEIGAAQVEATNRGTKASVEIGKATISELGGIKSNIDTQTNVVATGMARSNQLNAKIAMSNANILAALNQKTLTALGNINQNIATIVGFNNDTLMRQAEATMTYYNDSLSELRKISAALERAYPPEGKRNESESAYSQAGFSSYSANFNLEGYLKNVKENLKNTSGGMMLETLLDPMTLRALASNPVQTVVNAGVQMLTPKILNETMKAVDQSFSNLIPAVIGKLTDYGEDNDGILGTIARIFGMDLSSRKKGVRAYNKGAVPFDGITHKTINLVIPRYLSQIVSLLGGEAKMFDHESGTFKTEQQMKESVESDRRSAAKDAIGYDTIDYIDKEIKAFAESSSKSNKALEENLDKIQKATHEFLFKMVQANDGRRTVDLGSADQFKNIDPELAKVMPGLPEFIRQIMLNASTGMKNQFRASRYHYAENVRERTGNRSAGDYREPILADNYYSNANDTRFELSKDKKERLEHLNDKKKANNGKLSNEEEKELREIIRLKERLESGDIEFGSKIKGKSTSLTVGKNSLFTNYYQPMLDKMDMALTYLSAISSASTNAAPIKGKRRKGKKPVIPESAKTTSGGATVSFTDLQEEEQKEKNKKFRKLMSNPGNSSDEADNFGSLADKYKDYKADQKEKELEDLEDKVDNISDKQDENSRGFFSTMKMVLQSPAKALSQFLTGVDNTLYNLFFSDEKNKDGNESLIAHIMKPIKAGITDTFHGIVKTLNEEFFSPLKRIFYQDIIEGGLKQSFLKGMQSVRDWFNEDFDEDKGSSKKSSAASAATGAAKKAAEGIADAVAGGNHNAFGRHYAGGRTTDDPAYTAGVSAAARGDARVIPKTGYYSDASGKMILSKGERFLPDGTIIPAHHGFGGKSGDLNDENQVEQQIMTQAVADGTSGTTSALEKVNDAINKVAENTAQSADIAKKQDKREEKQEKEASAKKPNSIKNSLSEVLGDVKNSLNEYIFGKNTDEKGKQKPFKDQVIDMFAIGFRNFNNFFFGKDASLGDDKDSIEKYKKSFKESIPKGIARGLVFGGALALTAPFGGFGALGSLFLPGGIVGSAVLGLGVGMLTENRRIMNWLFGEKAPNGERVGGKIPKTITNFIKDNKTTLLGGFGVGMINTLMHFFTGNTIMGSILGLVPGGGAIGVLPALGMGFFGPVTMSVGAALLMRSSKVQNMLFGTTDEKTGKKVGGLANNKIMQELKGKFPNIASGAALGAGVSVLGSQFGILGSMMLGPYSAAILGGLVGFGLTSKKFKEAMFGKQDARGNFISGGLSDMIQNFFKAEVFNPAANFFQKEFVNTRAWFHQSVLAPILKSFSIYKDFGKYVAKSIFGHIKGVFETITGKVKSVFSPILDPLGKVFSFLVRNIRDTALGMTHAVSSISRSLISAPIKLLTLPATMISGYYRVAGNEEQKAAMKEINAKDKARRAKWKEEDDEAKANLKDDTKRRNKESKDLRKNGYEATEAQLQAKTDAYRKKQFELASLHFNKTKEIVDNQNTALDVSKSIDSNVAKIVDKLTGEGAAATGSQKLVSNATKKKNKKRSKAQKKAEALNKSKPTGANVAAASAIKPDDTSVAAVTDKLTGQESAATASQKLVSSATTKKMKGKRVKTKDMQDKEAFATVAETSLGVNTSGVTNAITPIASPTNPLKPNEKDKSLTAAGQVAERKEEGFRAKLLSMLGSIKGTVKGDSKKKDGLMDQLMKLLKGLALFGGLGSLINGLLNGKDISRLIKDMVQTVVQKVIHEGKDAVANAVNNSKLAGLVKKAAKTTGKHIDAAIKKITGRSVAEWGEVGAQKVRGVGRFLDNFAVTGDEALSRAVALDEKRYAQNAAYQSAKSTEDELVNKAKSNLAAISPNEEINAATDSEKIMKNLTEDEAEKYAKARAEREAAEKAMKTTSDAVDDLVVKSDFKTGHGFLNLFGGEENKAAAKSMETLGNNLNDYAAGLEEEGKGIKAKIVEGLAELMPKIADLFKDHPNVYKALSVIPGLAKKTPAAKFVKLSAKLAKAIGTTVGATNPIGWTIDAAFVVWGGIEGYNDAAEMFHCNEDDVTPGMRVTASLMQGLLSLPGIVYLDLALEVANICGGNDPKRWLLKTIYEGITGEEGKIDELSQKSDEDFKEWQKQAGNENKTWEDFIAEQKSLHGNKFVQQARNTKIGKTLFGYNGDDGKFRGGIFSDIADTYEDHPLASVAYTAMGGPIWQALNGAVFGHANKNGTMTNGLLTNTAFGKAWNNNLAWLFGDKGAEANKQVLDLSDPTVKRDLLIAAIGPEAAYIYTDDQIAQWDPTSGQFPDGKIMTDDQNAEIQTAIDQKNQQIDKDTYDLSRGAIGKAVDAGLAWFFGDKDADKNVQLLDLNNFDVKRQLAVLAFGDDAMLISDDAIANWDPTSGTAPDGQPMSADQQQAINDYVDAKNKQTQDAADKAKKGIVGRIGDEVGNTLAWAFGDSGAQAQLLDTGDPKVKMALLIRAGYDPNTFSYDSIVEWDPYSGTLPDGNILSDDENNIITQYIDNYNKEANDAARDKQNGVISTYMGKFFASIFGEEDSSYDENGTYKYNIIHRMEYAVENNLAYVMGYDVDPDTLEWTGRDDNKFLDDIKSQVTNTIVGVPMNLIESIAGIKFTDEERANNVKTLEGYLFGKNDENGNYVPGLFGSIFESLKEGFKHTQLGQFVEHTWPTIKKLFNATLGSLFSSDEQTVTIDNDTGEVSVEDNIAPDDKSFIEKYIMDPIEEALMESLEPGYYTKKIEGAWDGLMVSIFGTPEKLTTAGKISSFLYNGLLGTVGDALKYAWYKLKVGVASLGDKLFGTNHADEVEKPVYNGGMATFDKEVSASNGGDLSVDPEETSDEDYLSGGSDSSYQMEGNGDYSQNDSRWKNKNYNGTPFGGTGCGPTVMASVLHNMGKNVNPYELGTAAGAAGYKTNAGTNEKFLPDSANAFGVNATKLNSMDDIVTNVNSGKQVVVGGMSGSGYGMPFTPAGHYSRVTSINGGVATLADPRGYTNKVGLDELSADTKTAYVFSGNGDGTTEYGLPDFSQIDDSKGLFPGAYGIFKNWLLAGGPFYRLKRTFQTGFEKFMAALFGESNDTEGGTLVTSDSTETGEMATPKDKTWFPDFASHMNEGVFPGMISAVREWIANGAFYGKLAQVAKRKLSEWTQSLFGVSIDDIEMTASNVAGETIAAASVAATSTPSGDKTWFPDFAAHANEGVFPGMAAATIEWIRNGGFYGKLAQVAKDKINSVSRTLFGVNITDEVANAAESAYNYVTDTQGGLLADLQSGGWIPNFSAHVQSDGVIPGIASATWDWIKDGAFYGAFGRFARRKIDEFTKSIFGVSLSDAADSAFNYVTDTEGGLLADLQSGGWIPNFSAHVQSEGVIPGIASATWDWIKDGAFYGAFGRLAKRKIDDLTKSLFGVSLSEVADSAMQNISDNLSGALTTAQEDGWVPNFAAHYSEGMIPGAKNAIWEWIVEARPIKAFAKNFEQGLDTIERWVFGDSEVDAAGSDGIIKYKVDNTLAWIFGEKQEDGTVKGGAFEGPYNWIVENTQTYITDPLSETFDAISSGYENLTEGFNEWAEGAEEEINDNGIVVGGFNILKDLVSGLWGAVWDNSTIQGAVQNAESFIESGFQAIADFGAGLIAPFKEAWETIKDFKPAVFIATILSKAVKNGLGASTANELRSSIASFFDVDEDAIENAGGGIGGHVPSSTTRRANSSNYLLSYAGSFAGSGSDNGAGTYTQNDSAWASHEIAGNTGNMAAIGCGPTTAANALNSALGMNITPEQTARMITSRDIPTNGTRGVTANYFPDTVSKLGGEFIALNPNDKASVTNALADGYTLVAGGQSKTDSDSSTFTQAGHYTMLKGGYTRSGNPYTYSYDPLGGNRNKSVRVSDMLTDVRRGGPSMIGIVAPRGMGIAKGINGINLTALGAGGSGEGFGNFNSSYIEKYESQPGATDLESVQPDVANLFNQVAKDYYDQTGSKLTITGAAEKGYHAKGEFGHEGGWKLDVAKSADAGTLVPILNKYKIAAGDEGDHYDLSFNSGNTGGSLITDNATGPFAGSNSGNQSANNNKSGNNKAPKKQDPFSTFSSRFAQVARDYTMAMLLGKTYTGSTFEDESSGKSSAGNNGGKDYSGDAVDPVPSNFTAANIANGISAKTGIPAKLIWAQMSYEVGGFDNLSNGLMTEDHNYGGIKAFGDAKRSQYNAPSGEGGGAYRHFDSDDEFIDYQTRNYKAYAEDGLLDAKTPADFAAALKHGGYYQGLESDYSAGMDRWYKEVGGSGLLGGAGIIPLLNYYRMGGSGGENMSVKDSINAIVGQTMDNGTVGCGEATVKMGAGYSDFFKKLRDSGVASVEGIIGSAQKDGIGIVPYDANSLAPGDAVTYDNGTPREQVTVPDDDSHNNHIGLFEEMRNGVPWGADNSSNQNQVVERAIPRDWQNPAWILKTGDGSAGSSSGSSSGNAKGKQDKFGTFSSRFAQVARDYTMAMFLGKTYTGSTFEDGGSKSSSSGSANVTGENAKDTWNYLTGPAGFSKEDSAAIMGNFQAESGIDPKKVEGGGEADNITVGGPGYGLAQWTYPSRQQNLADYAASQNKPSGDLGVQLEFFNQEAHNDYANAISSMDAVSSIADKTKAWMDNYEGPDPAQAHLDDRQKSAQEFFDAYSGGSGGAGIGDGSTPSIADLTQQYNLQYDEYGNLKGYKGDESLLNNGTEDLQTRYHKQAQQVYAFLKMNPSGMVLSPLAALGMSLFGVIPGMHVSNGTLAGNPENTSLVNSVSGTSGITSVGGQLVKELCKKYNITADKFDGYLNLNIPGFTIPDNLKITDKDKNPTEIFHKQGQQIFLYARSQGYQGNLPMDKNAGTQQEQIAGINYYYDNNGAIRRVPNIADNINYRIGNEGNYGPRRVYLENMKSFSENSKDPNRALQYGIPIQYLESGHYKVDQNGRVHRRGFFSKLFPYLSDKMYQMKDNRAANRVENDLYRDLDMVRSYNGNSGGSGKGSNRTVYGPKRAGQYYLDLWDSKLPQRSANLYKKYGNIDYDLDGWRKRRHYGDAKIGPLSKADQAWRDAGHKYSYADYSYLSPFQMAADRTRRALDEGDGPFTMQTTERIASVSDKYKLTYDGYGNLIGYDGPADNIIDGTEDEVVKYSKQARQIALYLAKHKPPIGGEKKKDTTTTGNAGTTSKGATASTPDKNTQLIQELCKTYGIEFDIMNNIKNDDFTIPDEMRITGKEKDLTEVYHKQGLQVFAYAKQKGWTGTPPASAVTGPGSTHFKEIFMRSGLANKLGIPVNTNVNASGTLVTPNGVKLGTWNGKNVPRGYRVDIYGNLQKRHGWWAKFFPKQYDEWHTMKERQAYNKMLNNQSISGITTTGTANEIEKMSAADIAKLYGMTSVNFDQCMNVKMDGFTIPADLVITPQDDETTKYHKQGLQLKLYAKQHPEALKSQNKTTTNTQSDEKSKRVSEITAKYGIKYNAMGNINMPGFDIPSNLLITDQDGADSPEKYEKQYQQILAYEKWKTGTDGNANLTQRQTQYDVPKTVNAQVSSKSNVYTPNTAMATGQTSNPVNNLRSVNYSAGQSAADRYAQREYQANNNDLINAIHSLDVHAELQYMCETLKVIAGNQVAMNKNIGESSATTSAKLSTVASLAAKTAASGGNAMSNPAKAPSPERKRKAGTPVGNDYASIHSKNLEIARGGNFAVS